MIRVIVLMVISFQTLAVELTLDNVRIIGPKKNEIKVKKVRKSFHGKKIVKEQTELISTKPTDDNKPLRDYILEIIEKLNTELVKKLPKNSGEFLFRFQIQKSGNVDFLNARSSNSKTTKKIDTYFMQLSGFSPIPSNTGQKELQLEFKISK